MATMAAESAFIDTNVLVYASQRTSAYHQRGIVCLRVAAQGGQELWISRQILREYLATVSRPQRDHPALPMHEAMADVERFERDFNIAEDGPGVFARLRCLLASVPTAGKQVHDANIAATMLGHGLTRLLTFNAADFRRFEPQIEVVVP